MSSSHFYFRAPLSPSLLPLLWSQAHPFLVTSASNLRPRRPCHCQCSPHLAAAGAAELQGHLTERLRVAKHSVAPSCNPSRPGLALTPTFPPPSTPPTKHPACAQAKGRAVPTGGVAAAEDACAEGPAGSGPVTAAGSVEASEVVAPVRPNPCSYSTYPFVSHRLPGTEKIESGALISIQIKYLNCYCSNSTISLQEVLQGLVESQSNITKWK